LGTGLIYQALDIGFKAICIRPVPNFKLINNHSYIIIGNVVIAVVVQACKSAGESYTHIATPISVTFKGIKGFIEAPSCII
jgi:hypothetical protein